MLKGECSYLFQYNSKEKNLKKSSQVIPEGLDFTVAEGTAMVAMDTSCKIT